VKVGYSNPIEHQGEGNGNGDAAAALATV